jgi:hypothetical protein
MILMWHVSQSRLPWLLLLLLLILVSLQASAGWVAGWAGS